MLMSPNKSERVIHDCHCRVDMAVRMRNTSYTAELVVCVSVNIVVLVSQKPNLIRTKGDSAPRSVKVVHYTQTDSTRVKQIRSNLRM